LGSLLALLATMVIFCSVTDPANRQIAKWQPNEGLPGDWTQVRIRWEVSHGARAMLFLAALAMVVALIVQ
jgi:hypothetical protein